MSVSVTLRKRSNPKMIQATQEDVTYLVSEVPPEEYTTYEILFADMLLLAERVFAAG